MSVDVKIKDFWDDDFFSDFIAFKNTLYKNHPSHLSEGLKDLQLELESPYFKQQNIFFRGVLILLADKVVGRCLLYFDQKSSKSLRFGYFEVINKKEVYDSLFLEI